MARSQLFNDWQSVIADVRHFATEMAMNPALWRVWLPKVPHFETREADLGLFRSDLVGMTTRRVSAS